MHGNTARKRILYKGYVENEFVEMYAIILFLKSVFARHMTHCELKVYMSYDYSRAQIFIVIIQKLYTV